MSKMKKRDKWMLKNFRDATRADDSEAYVYIAPQALLNIQHAGQCYLQYLSGAPDELVGIEPPQRARKLLKMAMRDYRHILEGWAETRRHLFVKGSDMP